MEKTWIIHLYGIVQGVGMRPAVSRHAKACGIRGTAANMGSCVRVIAQGEEEDLEKFQKLLEQEPPQRALILKTDQEQLEPDDRRWRRYRDFRIVDSSSQTGEIFISPDIAICPDCQKELYDPGNRRYLHPFINCTSCGPRLTILKGLPYDRERTSMADFPMCPSCSREYQDMKSRRYHAQPVCCHDCGPRLYLADRPEKGRQALCYTRRVLAEGGIAAVKGIGGFHLCCDAADEETVQELRRRKRRPAKPFAVMMRDMETVRRECRVSAAQEKLLTGHQKPIVLLDRLPGGRVCAAVAPDNPKIGVMLPYAPVQMLLFDYPGDPARVPDCLVMTSANISGAPICRDDADAVSQLGQIADCILSNNRPILIRADDSVTDFFRGRPYMIRRSRGFAPLPFFSPAGASSPVLAAGGELKNSFCLTRGSLLYLSPFIGDMTDLRTLEAFKDSEKRMEELLELEPQLIVCDSHPLYNSRALALEMSRERGIPLLQLQHHYAHILSCMAENGYRGKVIGAAFDGTGYGTDGSIWGGEFLTADFDGFCRQGSLMPFLQAGGDLSARQGWRIAAALLADSFGREKAADLAGQLGMGTDQQIRAQLHMIEKRLNTVVSTSAGRLFDAVSALLGICRESLFEGQAAMLMQFAAERRLQKPCPPEADEFPGPLLAEGRAGWHCNTTGLFAYLTEERLRGRDGQELALLFHRVLAAMTAAACRRIRARTGIGTAALSGGVFQNTLLLEETVRLLETDGFQVLTHSLVPPGDGGISLGQAIYGQRALQKQQQ